MTLSIAKWFLGLLVLVLFTVSSLAALPVGAADLLGTEYGQFTGLGNRDVRATVGSVIQVGLSLLGIIALVIIIYAGFQWMTAGGNDEKAAEARKTMGYAVIGLIIILSAYAMSEFVIKRLYFATTGLEYVR